jgi:CrcB protein
VTYLWVALGSALGGMLRYWLSHVVDASVGETFPWGTLIVNVLGSFVIGVFATFTGPDGRAIVSSGVRIFVMIGLCGGFTTFSALSLQTLNLAREGEFFHAGMNVLLSVVLCLAAVWLGHIGATMLNQLKTA